MIIIMNEEKNEEDYLHFVSLIIHIITGHCLVLIVFVFVVEKNILRHTHTPFQAGHNMEHLQNHQVTQSAFE